MPIKGYAVHIVQPGDTIQGIAIQHGLSTWQNIVRVNGLVYPYIDSVVGSTEYKDNSKIAKVGEDLFIPSSDYLQQPKYTQITSEQLNKLAYGCDIDLYSFKITNSVLDFSIKGQVIDDSLDIKISQGTENLKQQLLTRLKTSKGALFLHPEYGSRLKQLSGCKGTTTNMIKIKLEVQETLTSDYRVKKVTDLTVTKTGTTIEVDCWIVPISPYVSFRLSGSLVF